MEVQGLVSRHRSGLLRQRRGTGIRSHGESGRRSAVDSVAFERRARLNGDGDLVAALIQKRPVAYQIAADGSRRCSTEQLSQECRRILRIPAGRLRSLARAGDRSGDHGGAVFRGIVCRHRVLQSVMIPRGWFTSAAIPVPPTCRWWELLCRPPRAEDMDLFLAVVNPALSASSQVIYVTYIGGDERRDVRRDDGWVRTAMFI